MKNWLALTIILALAASRGAALAAGQPGAKGVFVDRDAGRHPWRVNESRALMWDEQAYIPAGVVFTSAFLSSQTESDWQKDAGALVSLKTAGIADLLVRGPGPATSFPTSSWQKLIDHLEQQGFSYGIELDDGPAVRATGIVVCPRKYRIPRLTESGQLTIDLPHAQSGFFVIADPVTGTAIDSGYLRAANDKATLKLSFDAEQTRALLLFPTKEIATGRGMMPDLWQGADEYRDRLIDFFREIEFGEGFRFFYSPLAAGVVPAGDMVNAIPTSQSFHVEFEGWLSLKYRAPEALYSAWGIGRSDDASYEQAARLIPLWWEGRGLGLAFDRSTDTYLEVNISASAMWKDILDFRNASIQQALNAIADALKRCADAPVVFAADSYHSIYANNRDDGGFDGLSAVVSGDSDGDTANAGQAYALTFDSGKIVWFIGVVAPGADVSDIPRALARLKDIGAKGFFAQLPRDAPGSASPQPVLSAVADFGKQLDSTVEDYAPDVLFYPHSVLTGAGVRKVDQNTWWLPTSRYGQPIQIGENIFGYTLAGDARSPVETPLALSAPNKLRPITADGVVLWSAKGPARVTIKLRGQTFGVSEASKAAAQISPKKDVLTLQLSETPVLVYGLPPDQLFPTEIAESQIDILEAAVTAAARAGVNVSGYAASVEQARQLLMDFHPLLAYESASAKLRALAPSISQYVWIEAESARDHNLDGATALGGCSGARYLRVSTSEDPPVKPYGVTFTFNAPSEGSYTFWLAAAPPGRSGASGLEYSVDGGAWQAIDPSAESAPYADSIAWFRAGLVSLTPGQHTLALQVSKSDAPYYAAIDTLLLTKQTFTPNGTEKPPLAAPIKKKR
ncbi:MAG: hypothetical protein Q7T82_02610 [Armatimonadota bacterium]|nr:hypothetical protein [Armatimonadota bacterium]